MLADFYFGFGFFFAFLNLYYLTNSQGILGEIDEKSVSNLSSYLLSSIFVRIPYLLWIILGFLTSQWTIFIALVGITGLLFVFYESVGNNWIKFIILESSLFVEFLFTSFICLNHFHLGIRVSELLL